VRRTGQEAGITATSKPPDGAAGPEHDGPHLEEHKTEKLKIERGMAEIAITDRRIEEEDTARQASKSARRSYAPHRSRTGSLGTKNRRRGPRLLPPDWMKWKYA
jgi:hypothetical protein